MDTRERNSYLRHRVSARYSRGIVSGGPSRRVGKMTVASSVNRASDTSCLVAQHAQYVDSLVGRMMKELRLPGTHRDDITGAAYLGLVEAAERFDPTHGASFQAFSFLRIRGAIIDYMRDNAVIPHSLNRRIKAVVAASNLREQISLDKDSLSLIEKQRVVVELLGDYALIMRLSMESSKIINKSDSGLGPDELVDHKMRGSVLRRLISQLSPPERLVITQYYLEDKKFSEIVGLRKGFTKSWVSRLHRRGIESLRKLVLATKDRLGEEDVSSLPNERVTNTSSKIVYKTAHKRRKLIKGLKKDHVRHKIGFQINVDEPTNRMRIATGSSSGRRRCHGDLPTEVSNSDPPGVDHINPSRDGKRASKRKIVKS